MIRRPTLVALAALLLLLLVSLEFRDERAAEQAAAPVGEPGPELFAVAEEPAAIARMLAAAAPSPSAVQAALRDEAPRSGEAAAHSWACLHLQGGPSCVLSGAGWAAVGRGALAAREQLEAGELALFADDAQLLDGLPVDGALPSVSGLAWAHPLVPYRVRALLPGVRRVSLEAEAAEAGVAELARLAAYRRCRATRLEGLVNATAPASATTPADRDLALTTLLQRLPLDEARAAEEQLAFDDGGGCGASGELLWLLPGEVRRRWHSVGISLVSVDGERPGAGEVAGLAPQEWGQVKALDEELWEGAGAGAGAGRVR